MTVTLTNLLPNSAACSAGAGDLCPDSMVKTPTYQRRGLKRALPAARAVTSTDWPAFPRPTARFDPAIPAVRKSIQTP
jgi:hypothetical protein